MKIILLSRKEAKLLRNACNTIADRAAEAAEEEAGRDLAEMLEEEAEYRRLSARITGDRYTEKEGAK